MPLLMVIFNVNLREYTSLVYFSEILSSWLWHLKRASTACCAKSSYLHIMEEIFITNSWQKKLSLRQKLYIWHSFLCWQQSVWYQVSSRDHRVDSVIENSLREIIGSKNFALINLSLNFRDTTIYMITNYFQKIQLQCINSIRNY